MKRVGLYNIEPKIHNTALMKISQYHKDNGDHVEWYVDFERDLYDKIYCSSLFDFTDKSQVPENAICGGTGFDINQKLPPEIDECDLDYSIYPGCRTSYIWFSRGCFRNCPFCIVREKEGYIHPVKPSNLNPKGKSIKIMDNNFFGHKDWKKAGEYLDKWDLPIIFSSGIDLRIFEKDQAEFINKYVKLINHNVIHCAWDDPDYDMIPKIKEIVKYIKPYKLMCYVLIGFDSTVDQDLMRVEKLEEYDISPFVMPYNKSNTYQKRFARWVNNKAIFKSVKWEDYKG